MRESLKGVGEVSIYPAEIRGRIWYRVRLGPYRERLEARKVLARAVEAGARGAAIIRN
ncbi:MAG: SPOR domain-containing protein [Alphaproteobacteria bacterium]|nr:MAG: SPOR domain-containing protein [Alphaproteobacteria bacterium]